MSGSQTRFGRLENAIALVKSQLMERISSLEGENANLSGRLDKLDQPVQSSSTQGGAKKASVQKKKAASKALKRSVPVPKRPAVMEAAGVGHDPK